MSEDEALLSKFLGIDLEAERKKRSQQFMDYAHLCDTMNADELAYEIAKHFGGSMEQTAIILTLLNRINGR